MGQLLEGIFGELGITQYLEAFLDQGFDTWETILDITESDLDALGVKLGHRRKLQRRIANTRGLAPDISLTSPTQPSIEDLRLLDKPTKLSPPPKPVEPRRDAGTIVITKRKYRRHPKPDENAPERPPSAYVLFSNKMREELKGRNLSFTEIAKLVGENWQNLTAAEKEPYETEAQAIKDKFQRDLAEYKKTPQYRKYMLYLQDFKAKHSLPSQDKEVSKRVKLSDGTGGASRTSSAATPNLTSGSGSGTESLRGSEPPPPARQQRVGSTISASDSQYAATPSASYVSPKDEPLHSPVAGGMELRRSSERSPTFGSSGPEPPFLAGRHNANWNGDQRGEQSTGVRRNLPSLSDVIDGPRFLGGMSPTSEMNGFRYPGDHSATSPVVTPSGHAGVEGRPALKSEQSSSSSSASSLNHPWTPPDSSMPIRAMLTPVKTEPTYDSGPHQQPPLYHTGYLSAEDKQMASHHPPNGVSLPRINGEHHGPPSLPGLSRPSHLGNPPYREGRPTASPHQPHRKPDANLDGMNALLQAGEIVGRRPR